MIKPTAEWWTTIFGGWRTDLLFVIVWLESVCVFCVEMEDDIEVDDIEKLHQFGLYIYARHT